MSDSFWAVYKGGVGEIVEKKSRFLATVRPVETREEAEEFIQECKKKYYDAAHNCSAFVIGEKGQTAHASDDGEPSGTAGRPMLDVLVSKGICNVCVVVTRYFGGTLLGTGGLVKAYQKALQEGLSDCILIEKKHGQLLELVADYNDVGKIQYLLGQNDLLIKDSEYGEKVKFTILVPWEKKEWIQENITELTMAKAQMNFGNEVLYGKVGKEVIVF